MMCSLRARWPERRAWGLKPFGITSGAGSCPLPQGHPGGYRQYDRSSLRRLRFVRSAQELGFTLDEIRELLALKVEPGPNCAVVADRADLVIARVERKLEDLRSMRRALRSLRRACHDGDTSTECPILDALEEEDP